MKLKAGTLMYALFISVVLFLISGFFILYMHIKSQEFISLFQRDRLDSYVTSGMYIALSTISSSQSESSQVIKVFPDEKQEVEINAKPWGAFQLVSSYAEWEGFSSRKIGLVGNNFFGESLTSLYLSDLNDGVMSICGKSRIVGNAFLPGGRIKQGYVLGKSFTGKRMVEGRIEKSNSNLPSLNSSLISDCKKYLSSGDAFLGDSVINYEKTISKRSSITQSFLNKPIVLVPEDRIRIGNKKLYGNIIIKSNFPVELSQSAKCKDIIIYAPYIVVHSGFKGNVQLFASDSMLIKDNCNLLFPSVAAVISQGASFLTVEKGTKISGSVILYSEYYEKELSKLNINKNAEIYGIAYSNTYSELKGRVYGSFYTYRLFYKSTRGDRYENHLIDAVINVNKLPDEYCEPYLWDKGTSGELIKWLN